MSICMKNRSLTGIFLFALILTLSSCGGNNPLKTSDSSKTGNGYAEGSSDCSSELLSDYNDVVSETPTYRNRYYSYYTYNPYNWGNSYYFYGPYYQSYWPSSGLSYFSFGWGRYSDRDALLTIRYRATQFKTKYRGVVCEAGVKPESVFEDPYTITFDAEAEMDKIIDSTEALT